MKKSIVEWTKNNLNIYEFITMSINLEFMITSPRLHPMCYQFIRFMIFVNDAEHCL